MSIITIIIEFYIKHDKGEVRHDEQVDKKGELVKVLYTRK